MNPTETRPRVAVVGAGVSGLTAAYLLQPTHHVTLFDADDRLGGHAHTHDVPLSDGSVVPVDSGFIVLNDRTTRCCGGCSASSASRPGRPR